MADRQLFQLVTKVPLLTDVMGIQDTIGAVEQGKLTVQALKDIILLNLPVRIAKILVIRMTYSGSVWTHTIMESDYPGVNIVSIIGSPTVDITMSANIFDALKTDFFCNSVEGSGTTNVPLVVLPSVIASDKVRLKAIRGDGTTGGVGGSNPTWNNYFLTMLIYP